MSSASPAASIRFATRADALVIAEMSRDYIEAGLGWSWTRERILRSLRHRDTNAIVAVRDADRAGFAIMKYGDDEAHLLLLAVERHDARAFAEHLHAGAVFDAGSAEADRGRDAVMAAWEPIIAGSTIALRWRPGIVQIGGEPGIAISRGPFILQRVQGGADVVRVGFYQTVWLRDAGDGVWRVLYDAAASTAQAMADRAAAERWVEEQGMSDCAP